MNFLVTLNSNYVDPLCTMLKSLVQSNVGQFINLYVAHSSLCEDDFLRISSALSGSGYKIHPIVLDNGLFESAPTKKRISKETYYRIFAPLYLPKNVERILYIDPDTVVINSLSEFYASDFGDNEIIGAKHFDGNMNRWNKFRLFMRKSPGYINAGIMLLNIKKMRESFDAGQVFRLVNRKLPVLFLADQDLINIMYDGKIGLASEFDINLDERTFKRLVKKYGLKQSLNYVKRNTAIIHFNGKYKPWKSGYKGFLKPFYDKYKDSVAIPFERCLNEGA